eukprot:jgi/Botrbrau1/18531/Bobra.0842s0003.1
MERTVRGSESRCRLGPGRNHTRSDGLPRHPAGTEPDATSLQTQRRQHAGPDFGTDMGAQKQAYTSRGNRPCCSRRRRRRRRRRRTRRRRRRSIDTERGCSRDARCRGDCTASDDINPKVGEGEEGSWYPKQADAHVVGVAPVAAALPRRACYPHVSRQVYGSPGERICGLDRGQHGSVRRTMAPVQQSCSSFLHGKICLRQDAHASCWLLGPDSHDTPATTHAPVSICPAHLFSLPGSGGSHRKAWVLLHLLRPPLHGAFPRPMPALHPAGPVPAKPHPARSNFCSGTRLYLCTSGNSFGLVSCQLKFLLQRQAVVHLN